MDLGTAVRAAEQGPPGRQPRHTVLWDAVLQLGVKEHQNEGFRPISWVL